MQSVYLTTAYLAPTSYYAAIAQSQCAWIEQHDNYLKQSYRTRCNIVGAGGIQSLSIPVERISGIKTPTRDIEISQHGNWQHLHWQAICSAYGSAPFFEYYQEEFYPFYHRPVKYLFDLNQALQETLLRLLQIDTPIHQTETYAENFAPNEVDLRHIMHPKQQLPEELAARLLPSPYYQVFDQKLGFQPNMSIIDLLFNLGNESLLLLKGLYRDPRAE